MNIDSFQIPRFEKHIITERLKSLGLPVSDTRISFIWWLENVQSHIMTQAEYVEVFGENNRYRTINEYLESGYLTRVWHDDVIYYVSSFATSKKTSPFLCTCCNTVNVVKMLNNKQSNITTEEYI